MREPSHQDIILDLMGDGKLLRPLDVVKRIGASARQAFMLLEREGKIVRERRGAYRIANSPTDMVTERWQELAVRYPRGILCLQSAQMWHGITDQLPEKHFVADPTLSPNYRRRGEDPIHIVTWTDAPMWSVGVERVEFSGNAMSVTDKWRTVADMFRPVHHQNQGEAVAALVAVATEDGEEGLTKVSEYAMILGWHRRLEGPIRTAKEMLKCAVPRR